LNLEGAYGQPAAGLGLGQEEAEEEGLYGDEDNENEENEKELTEAECDMLMLHRSMATEERVATTIPTQERESKQGGMMAFTDILEE